LNEYIEDMDEDDDDDDNNPGKMMETAIGSNIYILDVEYRFQNDPETVLSLLSGVISAAKYHQDLMPLKLILASGLSPQVTKTSSNLRKHYLLGSILTGSSSG